MPDTVLAEWGYETTRLGPHQAIRQIEPLPGAKQRWHPRFDLWNECCASNEATLARMAAKEKEIEAENKNGLGMPVHDECVTFVSAQGTLFMLEFQPKTMRERRKALHALTKNAPARRNSTIYRSITARWPSNTDLPGFF